MESCEKCCESFKKSSILRHIGQAKACKAHYGPRLGKMKDTQTKQNKRERMQRLRKNISYKEIELKKQREKYAENPEKKLRSQRKRYAKNRGKILSKRSKSYAENPEKYRKRKKIHYKKNKEKLRKDARDKARALRYDSDANMAKYKKSIEFGPEFVCVCCHGGFFEEQVLVLTDKRKKKIGNELMGRSFEIKEIRENWYDPRNKGRFFLCKSCYRDLIKKKQMPKRSIKNDLTVEALEGYTSLENQLIAPCLLFMKIVKLPKSRMEAMKDRTVIVPLEPGDIMKNVEALPRTMEEGAVVQVDFKRMKDMKNTHQSELVRPFKLYELLATLKDAGNLYYKNVLQKCLYCDKNFKENETNIYDHVKKCFMEFQARGKNILIN